MENSGDEIDWRAMEKGLPQARRTADSNPATTQANDCLKIAKVLANLLNELAGLDQTSREQIAQAAGLQQLPESIDRLYELADQIRMGGVQNLQTAYAGWEPDSLRRRAKPFVSLVPDPTVSQEPEQAFQAPNQQARSAHEPEVLMDKP